MSDRVPHPLAAVCFDAGDTLLTPYPVETLAELVELVEGG
jgi:hypothetical protein